MLALLVVLRLLGLSLLLVHRLLEGVLGREVLVLWHRLGDELRHLHVAPLSEGLHWHELLHVLNIRRVGLHAPVAHVLDLHGLEVLLSRHLVKGLLHGRHGGVLSGLGLHLLVHRLGAGFGLSSGGLLIVGSTCRHFLLFLFGFFLGGAGRLFFLLLLFLDWFFFWWLLGHDRFITRLTGEGGLETRLSARSTGKSGVHGFRGQAFRCLFLIVLLSECDLLLWLCLHALDEGQWLDGGLGLSRLLSFLCWLVRLGLLGRSRFLFCLGRLLQLLSHVKDGGLLLDVHVVCLEHRLLLVSLLLDHDLLGLGRLSHHGLLLLHRLHHLLGRLSHLLLIVHRLRVDLLRHHLRLLVLRGVLCERDRRPWLLRLRLLVEGLIELLILHRIVALFRFGLRFSQ